ncbi:MAG: excinuclease ABC subunit UvrA [Patescibacteria group bacterium]
MSKEKSNKRDIGTQGTSEIAILGARTHNLKNIDVYIPRNKMVVITGLSGSGKSSLAFDTIFAEGQRRYIESLSAYARQFLNQMQKPDVDEIRGLSPAIAIDQKSRSNNPRSTVATITEIYDYLRVLFARIGRPYCLECGREISKLSVDEIVHFIQEKIEGAREAIKQSHTSRKVMGVDIDNSRILLFAPVVRERKGEYYQLLYDLLGKGYAFVRVDGKLYSLREKINLGKNKKHTIEVLMDEYYFSEFATEDKDFYTRLAEGVEKALDESEGLIQLTLEFDTNSKSDKEEVQDIKKEFLLSAKYACPHDGFSFGELEPRLFSFNSPAGACEVCNGTGSRFFFGKEPCLECGGTRLRKESLAVFIGSGKSASSPIAHFAHSQAVGKNIADVSSMTIEEAYDFFATLELSDQETSISLPVMKEITDRLSFMLNVGIEYLTLDRRASTLSGGEAQRIRLASQLGSGLVGAMYVLDEPTIGLHQRDNDRLIHTLHKLRDLGNTVIVVEHDEDVIYSADYLVDIGPQAGIYGGEVVVSDWLEDLLEAKSNTTQSRTLGYLRGEIGIALPESRRSRDKGSITITGASIHNIHNLNAKVPLGKLVAITGVSGSGKSSFVHDVLYRNLEKTFDRKKRSAETINCAKITGLEYLTRAISIDQSPIGRTPRSNPATYTGMFTHIRDIFAETSEARVRGYKPGRFSFNVKGGRCEACQGNGYVAVEMHFLPTVYVDCDVCHGKRFNKETLEVTYKGKNIHEVLEMNIQTALAFWQDIPAVYDRLKTLDEVGLGYLKIGQPATTLSGGEAQRVKIASELYRPFTERTIYLLDEPTVGLHYDDVARLNQILELLVERGNSVVVIEHNLDFIKICDHIIDFGPEGGAKGGKIVATGTPEQVASNSQSLTGKYLATTLKKAKKF